MAIRGSIVKKTVVLMFVVSTLSVFFFLRKAPEGQGNDSGDITRNETFQRSTLLFVGIYSAPRHHDRRMVIRETWMKKCVKWDKVVCWFITNVQDVEGRALTGQVREKLDNESRIHGDMALAQSPGGTNFARTYIWMAQWGTQHYDFQYILRVDDDYFVCFDKLLLELEFHRPKQKLVWGWLHCRKKVVAVDAGFLLVTRDIIQSILSRVNTTLVCTRFDGQAMAMWLKNYPGLIVFADNKRLFHTKFDSKEKAAKRKELCQTALGIHKSFPEEMKIYWNVYQKEPNDSINYVIPPTESFCKLPYGVDYRVFGKKFFAVPRLCKENPVWNTSYIGRSGMK